MNFFGGELPPPPPGSANDLHQALESLYMGKQIIDGRIESENAAYIAAFRTTDMTAPGSVTDYGEYFRYRRAVFVYQSILAAAGFTPPTEEVSVSGLFSQEVIDAMRKDSYAAQLQEPRSWDSAIAFCKEMSEWFRQGGGRRFDRDQAAKPSRNGRSWSDDRLLGLLRIFENTRGAQALRECREWHDPSRNADYTDEIVDDLEAGRLVILDQALGDPLMNEQSAERIMRKIFARQQETFTRPRKAPGGSFLDPDPVIIYVEEAHTLLPRGSEEDTRNIWARTAKEGAKFNIGLVYSTQEPSSIQRNILRNTENWFLAHLNSTGETRELDQYNDFADFSGSIRRVKEPGFLKVRTMSSPYTLPVQIDRFTAPAQES